MFRDVWELWQFISYWIWTRLDMFELAQTCLRIIWIVIIHIILNLNNLSKVHTDTDKSKVEISQNFVAFSEYMNFYLLILRNLEKNITSLLIHNNPVLYRAGPNTLHFPCYVHIWPKCKKVGSCFSPKFKKIKSIWWFRWLNKCQNFFLKSRLEWIWPTLLEYFKKYDQIV